MTPLHIPVSGPLGAPRAPAAVVATAHTTTISLSGSGTHPAQSARPTNASVLRPLTPQARNYVQGIMSMSPQQIQAAYGTVK